MGSLLYLISIFSAFDLNINNEQFNVVSESRELGMEVEFAKVPHLSVGDPVLYKGQSVGSVLRVESSSRKDVKDHGASSVISIKITDLTIPVTDELVGLVAKVKVPVGDNKTPAVRSALELLAVNSNTAPKNSERTKLMGFGSFEEFWTSSSKIVPTI